MSSRKRRETRYLVQSPYLPPGEAIKIFDMVRCYPSRYQSVTLPVREGTNSGAIVLYCSPEDKEFWDGFMAAALLSCKSTKEIQEDSAWAHEAIGRKLG